MGISEFSIPNTYIICTSSTRPSGSQLFEGLMIYETDTGMIYTYGAVAGGWNARMLNLQQTTVLQTNPPGNDDLTAAAFADWGSTTTVTIPSWATTAYITTSICGAFPITAAGGFQFRVVLDGITGRTVTGITGDFTNNPRASLSWSDSLTGFSTGASKTIKTQGFRSSGTGALRVDVVSDFTYHVTFSA